MTARPVIVITGGSSGIGAATARRFATGGWHVVITGRHAESLAATAGAIREAGGAIETAVVDVSDAAAMTAFGASIPRIDCCFVNAGVFQTANFEDCTIEEWQRQLDINLTGGFNTIRACLPQVRAQRGLFLLNASIAAKIAFPGNAAYAASKWGLRGLGEVLRVEEAPHGVRVTTLYLGATDTPIWDKRAEPPFIPRTAMIDADELAATLFEFVGREPAHQEPELTVLPRS